MKRLLLSDFYHFLNEPLIKFREETIDGKTFVIVAYTYLDDKLFNFPLSQETRGMTFLKETGECVSFPFPKFFNIGEKEYTLPQNLPWDKPYLITEKLDGSMLVPVLINEDKVLFKSKKTFFSDVAIAANKNMTKEIERFSLFITKLKMTPIFEYTSPENKIVLDYGNKPKFTLLAIRNISDGSYVCRKDLEEMAEFYNIPLVSTFTSVSFEYMKDKIKEEKNIEGYVIHFLENDLFVKYKTDWYNKLHRINTDIRHRDIAEMVISETLDDFKAMCILAGKDIQPLLEIETQVLNEIKSLERELDIITSHLHFMSFKDIANIYKDHSMFGLIMQSVRNKTPDIKGFWVKNYLKNYSLISIYNENF